MPGYASRRGSADFDVSLTDITGGFGAFAVWGPAAREIVGSLTSADVSDEGFPFMTSQAITVGDVPVRALRVTFTGEHGWELYPSMEYAARLWEQLWTAGADHGLVPCGYRAIESLRLGDGLPGLEHRHHPGDHAVRSGLGFCVKLDKPGGFVGDDALREAKAAGLTRKLSLLVLDDPRAVVLGLSRSGSAPRSSGGSRRAASATPASGRWPTPISRSTSPSLAPRRPSTCSASTSPPP